MIKLGNFEFKTKEDLILYFTEVGRSLLSWNSYQETLTRPRYTAPKRLLRHGYKVYSQNDEDGIIHEIFKRIGIESRTFIEIGVEIGTECNTMGLLVDSWKGLWIEANSSGVAYIKKNIIPSHLNNLVIKEAMVTIENVNNLIEEYATGQIDLLSIDIDFNDYWIWKAVDVIKPRVVIIEYNALFGPHLSLTVPYDPNGRWDGVTNYFGTTLEALVRLGREKGYKIVGCNFSGVNAFFVRDDLIQDKFLEPFTAEEHYEPPRYHHFTLSAHVPLIGPLVKVE